MKNLYFIWKRSFQQGVFQFSICFAAEIYEQELLFCYLIELVEEYILTQKNKLKLSDEMAFKVRYS